MQLIVWNSQGSNSGTKWDVLWDNWITSVAAANAKEDILAFMVESGIPSWYDTDHDIYVNNVYELEDDKTYFDTNCKNTAFYRGVRSRRQNTASWIPWVKTIKTDSPNARCSMAAVIVPYTLTEGEVVCVKDITHLRPLVRMRLSRKEPFLTIALVHLTSGNWKKANDELADLVNSTTGQIPESTAAIIVGDMNIDINNVSDADLDLPEHWKCLRSNAVTQKSGGELDFALLYDPKQRFSSASAAQLMKYNTGQNKADHSVMQYSLTIKK